VTVHRVSSEAQNRQRLAELKTQLETLEPEPPPSEEELAESLEALVEKELKKQLRSLEGRELGLAIMNAIKFLAVRAKMPVTFGGELDEGAA